VTARNNKRKKQEEITKKGEKTCGDKKLSLSLPQKQKVTYYGKD